MRHAEEWGGREGLPHPITNATPAPARAATFTPATAPAPAITPPPPSLPMVRSLALSLDAEQQLELLDALGAPLLRSLPGAQKGDEHLLRLVVASCDRIGRFRSRAGRGQANFVRSILQAIGSGRMVLGSMTTWAFFYGARPWDEHHCDLNASGFSWTLDGGFYKEALQDFLWVAGERGLQMLFGPHWSNMVLGGDAKRGHYHYNVFDHPDQIERIFWSFLPSPRSLRPRKAVELIEHAGTPPPLRAALTQLAAALAEEAAKQLSLHVAQVDDAARRQRLAARTGGARTGGRRLVLVAVHGEGARAEPVLAVPPRVGADEEAARAAWAEVVALAAARREADRAEAPCVATMRPPTALGEAPPTRGAVRALGGLALGERVARVRTGRTSVLVALHGAELSRAEPVAQIRRAATAAVDEGGAEAREVWTATAAAAALSREAERADALCVATMRPSEALAGPVAEPVNTPDNLGAHKRKLAERMQARKRPAFSATLFGGGRPCAEPVVTHKRVRAQPPAPANAGAAEE